MGNNIKFFSLKIITKKSISIAFKVIDDLLLASTENTEEIRRKTLKIWRNILKWLLHSLKPSYR